MSACRLLSRLSFVFYLLQLSVDENNAATAAAAAAANAARYTPYTQVRGQGEHFLGGLSCCFTVLLTVLLFLFYTAIPLAYRGGVQQQQQQYVRPASVPDVQPAGQHGHPVFMQQYGHPAAVQAVQAVPYPQPQQQYGQSLPPAAVQAVPQQQRGRHVQFQPFTDDRQTFMQFLQNNMQHLMQYYNYHEEEDEDEGYEGEMSDV